MYVPTKVAGSIPPACYPKWVKPLMMIIEHIEVAHLVDGQNVAAKPGKGQGCEQPTKKFAPSTQISKKSTHACTEHMHAAENCELCKKHGGMHTTHDTTECCKYNTNGTPT